MNVLDELYEVQNILAKKQPSCGSSLYRALTTVDSIIDYLEETRTPKKKSKKS